MEPSPVEPSEVIDDGSVEAVTARLLLWCKRTPPALAQVEFVDDNARRLVVKRLRANLGSAEIHFEEISLPAETTDLYVPDHLIERLRSTPAGVVSVDGFAAAFPYDRSKLEESIYRLSLKRELLSSPSHRQIWWVPTYLADLFEKTAPDLESWIQLKLRLTVSSPAGQSRLEAIAGSSEPAADPAQARQQAEDALRRFQRAVEQGTSPVEGISSLVQPAIDLLRRARLAQEARELERRSLEVVIQRSEQPGARERSGAAQSHVDVFISYTGNESSWARWVDFLLREAGYTTKVQLYDFMAGKSFLGAITEALTRSRWVLGLLSPSYLESRWCQEEWQAAHLAKKLILMRIAACEPKGLLAPLVYLDLVGVSEDEAQERILAELKKRDGADPRPVAKPAFPGSAPWPTRPRFPGSLPAIWNITEERNPYFTGRQAVINRLHEALTAGNTAALTQAIVGLGGVGKTQLALEYAYRYANVYEGVWWLHAEEPMTLARDYVALAPCLGIEVVADQEQMVRKVRETLSQRKGILLIFDNATEPSTLKPYLPLGPGRHVIVTTRAQSWPGANAQEVHELPLEVATEFLLKRTGQADKAAAEDVAKRLGCLPLALDQAAAYVVTCQKKLSDYATLLANHGLDVLEKGQPYQYEKTVGTTWALAIEQVQAKCPAAVDLLHLCAFLAPEAIHVRDLVGASKHLTERLSETLADELGLDEIKAALLAFSLIRTDGETLAIHRLVSEVMRKHMDPEVREEWLRSSLRAVNELFPNAPDDVGTWPACSRWLAHALAVVNWDRADTVDPSACTQILNRIGIHLHSKADYEEAEHLCRRALAIAERSFGPNHPSVAVRLNNLAMLLKDTNRLFEAEPLCRRALAIDEASYGLSHPDVAGDLNNLALILKATNRLSDAEPLFYRALAIDEASYGAEHPQVAGDLNNLALLLQATNRRSEAERLFHRALAIGEASYSLNHPQVAAFLNNLAMLLKDANRLSEAEPMFRRAANILERSLGPDHPNTLGVRKNLDTLLAAQGQGKR